MQIGSNVGEIHSRSVGYARCVVLEAGPIRYDHRRRTRLFIGSCSSRRQAYSRLAVKDLHLDR